MRDEIDGRLWQAHHADLSASLSTAIESVAYAFDRLQARLYDAPWERRKGAPGRTC